MMPYLHDGPMRVLTGTLAIVAVATLLSACAVDSVARRQEAVAQDPSAMMRIANAAEASGDTDGAAAFYRRSADLQPSSDAEIGIAHALAQQGDIDQAIETLRSAKRRDPSNIQLCLTLGRLLVAANRPAEGLVAFEDGLQQDPDSVSLLIGRGVALDAIGRHMEAQECYRKAVQLEPDNAAARKDLALSLTLEKQGGAKARAQ
jgi:Flp pilus assembly protein TadD